MFEKYVNSIIQLNNFNKEDILNDKFILEDSKNLKIYYAPHNEYINKQAKILIVGITPGWTQTQIAYRTAYEGLIEKVDYKNILKKCKFNSRFSGSMRKNLIEMLDELELNVSFNLQSCKELFNDDNKLLHTTSLIKYPVFVNGKNYNGHNPELLKNELLYSYVKEYFVDELNQLNDILIIPLGKAVEEVFMKICEEKMIKEDRYIFLYGFPHPSGANGHRKEAFSQNKESLRNIINKL